MRNMLVVFLSFLIAGCIPPSYSTKYTVYSAHYSISLFKVERPEKATQRYRVQKIDTLTEKKYRYSFEDDLVKALWSVSGSNISFSIQNKTDHSIKIPWDEAAFIDESGSSHRVMHAGVKYTDRQQPQAPSIIARKASIEDLVFPTDYVEWKEGSRYTSGKWDEKPFFEDFDFHGDYTPGNYPTFESFDRVVKSNIGKSIQVTSSIANRRYSKRLYFQLQSRQCINFTRDKK